MTRSPLQHPFSRRTLLRSGLALGAGISLGSLVGCATPTGTPGPGTASLALNRSLVSLDNKLNQFDAAVTVQRAVRQALITLDQHLKPQLVLADRFELTNPTQWYVHLRPGIIYSDGRPVQVQDVATALKMYSEVSGSFVGGFFPEWPTVDQIDESSFTLNTVRPVPVLDYLMTNILITPAADNRPEELQSGVGSGPYVVTASNRGTGNYTLAKNPKYWAPAPNIDSVQVRFVPDESNRVVSLRSSEVDVIDSISPDSADQLSGLSGVAIDRVDGVRLNQLFYNFRKPPGHPLADARVRRALTYAIDGKSLIDEVMQGSATASKGVIPITLTVRSRRASTSTIRPVPARSSTRWEFAISISRSSGRAVNSSPTPTSWKPSSRCCPQWVCARSCSSSSPAATSPPGVRAKPATGTSSATATLGPPAWPSPSCRECTPAPPPRKPPATPTTATSFRRSPRSSPGHPKTPIPPGA